MDALAATPKNIETQFREMNRAMALVLLEECFDKATADNAPFSAKLDLLKLNTKLGELEPKVAQQSVGNGVTFIISLPGTAQNPGQTIVSECVSEAKMVLELPEMLEKPSFLPEKSSVLMPADHE